MVGAGAGAGAGTGWRERQLRKIADEAFDRIRTDSHDDRLTFQDLYIAVLYAYKYHLPALSQTLSLRKESMMTLFPLLASCSDINKFLPGPHNDPPSKEKLKAMIEVSSARNSSPPPSIITLVQSTPYVRAGVRHQPGRLARPRRVRRADEEAYGRYCEVGWAKSTGRTGVGADTSAAGQEGHRGGSGRRQGGAENPQFCVCLHCRSWSCAGPKATLLIL
ncbi:hypothetical protein B296_00042162 [Ensete ventricosum]|uniref:EF-hand domain-containing protein n=1 Tax=Ensete ventricosum TaxID=4639 RepID=A0A426YBF9_ENSVE|nr:hypothetical protein B296_00042162 [Ensete ventricosum]